MTPNKMLAAAKADIDTGYREGENNKNKFGDWQNIPNQPWCASAVSYWFNQAGAVKLVAAQSKTKGFWSCDAGLKWFAKNGQLVSIEQAQPGDVVFFQFDTDAEPEHVGVVYVNQPDKKTLITFEGNTCPDGSSGSQANGNGAYKKKRPYAKVMAVCRPTWDTLK